MVPHFEIAPIPLWGPVVLQPFGLLVGLGIVIGVLVAIWRGRQVGIPADEMRWALLWTLTCGFFFTHVVEVAFYHPEKLRQGGVIELFRFWDGMSSLGGFIGGFSGVLFYCWRIGEPVTKHGEVVLQGLVVGETFGRLGCSLVHDHVGLPTDFFLGVKFPDGSRHDLGLYEFLYLLLVVNPAWMIFSRYQRRFGMSVVLIVLLYAPARFTFDFLREPQSAGGDLRYLGLTFAQYGCIGIVVAALVARQILSRRTYLLPRADLGAGRDRGRHRCS